MAIGDGNPSPLDPSQFERAGNTDSSPDIGINGAAEPTEYLASRADASANHVRRRLGSAIGVAVVVAAGLTVIGTSHSGQPSAANKVPLSSSSPAVSPTPQAEKVVRQSIAPSVTLAPKPKTRKHKVTSLPSFAPTPIITPSAEPTQTDQPAPRTRRRHHVPRQLACVEALSVADRVGMITAAPVSAQNIGHIAAAFDNNHLLFAVMRGKITAAEEQQFENKQLLRVGFSSGRPAHAHFLAAYSKDNEAAKIDRTVSAGVREVRRGGLSEHHLSELALSALRNRGYSACSAKTEINAD